MQYRLVRELPFAKVGTILEDSCGYIFVKGKADGYNAVKINIGGLDKLLKDGWVEQIVVPREWWKIVYPLGNRFVLATPDFIGKQDAEQFLENKFNPNLRKVAHVIKVQEVLK